MKKLVIEEINNYDYILKDELNNQYELNLEFYGLDKKLSVGDVIYLNKKLLVNDAVYSFGLVKDFQKDIKEYIKVILSDQEYYLERYYG